MMARTEWNRQEDKLFERLLLMFPEPSLDRWQNIASRLPGKSPSTVKEHYEALVHDVHAIEWGRVQLPTYADDSLANQISFGGLKHSSNSNHRHDEPERKKGTPWTPDEHRLFLIGLSKYGKGDWRSISRNVVVTRTPTQVASHAQKYFLRQDSVKKKDRKRSSIHDITTVDNNSPVPPPVGSRVQQQPPPIDQQQPPLALQKFLPPPSQFPGYGGSEEYQNNYGYGI